MLQDIVIRNNISNDTPFLTIGVINYNYGKYLSRNFEALQRQQFHNIELIYADNNSTDNSRFIIQDIMKKASFPVSLVTGENIGICGNRNRIIDHARGKYLLFYDADDWMTDDCLEILCNEAIKTNADQIAGLYQKIDNKGKILYKHAYPNGAVKWSIWGFHGVLFKMQLIRKCGLRFKADWKADDDCFNALYHQYSNETVFVHKVVENWYKHDDSVSSMYSERAKEHKTSYTSAEAFEQVTSYMVQIWYKVSKQDQEQLEYMWTIMYYYVVLYRRPSSIFKEDFEEYVKLHHVILNFFPNYTNNPALRKLNGNGYYRKKVCAVAFFMSFFERFHFIKIALWGYWVLSHVYKMGY